jgi:hypothetical protein
MNGPPRLAGVMDGGLKRLAKVPRSVVLLICLCLLTLGGFTVIQRLLFAFSDETAHRVIVVFLADLNADGHQDAFLVTNQMHRIVFNDGTGDFTSSRELFMQNYALALGDLDGDAGLEAILFSFGNGEFKLTCADMPSDVVLPVRSAGAPSQVFAIWDGNSDGLPEGYIAGCCGGGAIMHNYETILSNHRACLETEAPRALALGDLNGDGALDAFIVKVQTRTQGGMPNEVWFNDGLGNFADSGQRLGDDESYSVALGDLNGDGFLDAVVGNSGSDEVWFNDGQGNFTNGGQRLGRSITHTIFISDLDGDGDLDLFLGDYKTIRVWLNDGDGSFKSGQLIKFGRYDAVSVGEVTGDGIMDVFVGGPDSYQVWRGDGQGRFSAEGRSAYR